MPRSYRIIGLRENTMKLVRTAGESTVREVTEHDWKRVD
jgi:hypothetical protein